MRALRPVSVTVMAAFLAVLCATGAVFGQPLFLGRGTAPSAARGTRAGARATVFGYVWNANTDPIAGAMVRLRNVVSGRIEAHATATDTGEFEFSDVEGGTYVIEYVDEHGKVLATGHVFSVSPGETVATFIRLGSHVPWFAALFGSASNAAATAVASAASLGVTAIAPGPRQVTSEQ